MKHIGLVLLVAYGILLASQSALRGDYLLLVAIYAVTRYGGSRMLRLHKFLLPFIATAIIYDSQRFYARWLSPTIHVQEPYLFDRRYFGMRLGDQLLTPSEWLQFHTHPVLDVLSGLTYLIYIPQFIFVAAYFYFWRSKKSASQNDLVIQRRAYAMPWSFLWVNAMGYATYLLYPAAPPWYVSEHGFSQPTAAVASNPAGCVRFDQLFGTDVFASMYGRAANVFGAIPSLHAAYPLLALLFAFYFRSRIAVFCAIYYGLMCFSAVYLNHHYVLDVLWGSVYAVVVFAGCEIWANHKTSQENAFAAATQRLNSFQLQRPDRDRLPLDMQ
ncbi:MAG: phosphatase PAP2 family protein [Bdellovibrionota bacterium]